MSRNNKLLEMKLMVANRNIRALEDMINTLEEELFIERRTAAEAKSVMTARRNPLNDVELVLYKEKILPSTMDDRFEEWFGPEEFRSHFMDQEVERLDRVFTVLFYALDMTDDT